MNLSSGMSNEIKVTTIALPFRSSLTTFDTDSRIAELSAKKGDLCAKRVSFCFYLVSLFCIALFVFCFCFFFRWLLELTRSDYQNNSWYAAISLRPTFLWIQMRDESKVTGTHRRGSTTTVTVSSFSLLHGCSWLFYKLIRLGKMNGHSAIFSHQL